jgi:hypothetical protein
MLGLIIAFSCDLFEPRKPEDGGAEDGFEAPVRPGIVIENLVGAFNERDAATYLSCFDTDSFRFFPDPQDTLSLALREPLRDFGFGAEDTTIISIFAALAGSEKLPPNLLQLTPLSADSTDSAAEFYERYEILIDLPRYPYCRGKARFSLVKIGSFWYIRGWQDFREDTTDWGELKAAYRR